MQPNEITVWLILDSGKIGGIETHVVQLATYLVRHNYHVQVIFLNDYSHQPIALRLQKLGVYTQFLNGRLSSFYNLIQQKKPNLLHAHGYKPGVLCKLLGWICRTPVVCTHHPGKRGKGRIYFYNWLDENMAFLANQSIAVSKPIKLRLLTSKSLHIPNFVEMPLGSQLTTNFKSTIGFVGRFCSEKGPDLFCQLSKFINQPLKMQMFGSGEMFEALKTDYQHAVTFHGDVDNIYSFLTQLDLLCITSRSEGLPLVALEAMALGIPVISFAVGGLPELIQSGKNGFLIAPGELAAFADGINNFYGLTSQERFSIQLAAQQTIAKEYSAEVLGKKIEEVYQTVLRSYYK